MPTENLSMTEIGGARTKPKRQDTKWGTAASAARWGKIRGRIAEGMKFLGSSIAAAPDEPKPSPKEIARTCSDAGSRVLLEQKHDELDARGNLTSDSFTSLMDEATGLLTMLTVYQSYSAETGSMIFTASYIIYSINVTVRLLVGLWSLLSPPKGVRWIKGPGGTTSNRTIFTAVLSILVVMVEPVFGIRLVSSVHELEEPLTEAEREGLMQAKADADDSEIDARGKVTEAEEKAAAAESEASALGFDSGVTQKMLDVSAKEVDLLKDEAAVTSEVALLARDEADETILEAELEVVARQLRLDVARLRAAERVEIIMALFEDVPELVLALWFITSDDAIDGSSSSDIGLFITNAAVSIFHASKCLWSWYQHRKLIRAALRGDGKAEVKDYNGYFVVPKVDITDLEATIGRAVIDCRKPAIESRKANVAAKRAEYELELTALEKDTDAEGKRIIAEKRAADEERKKRIDQEKKEAELMRKVRRGELVAYTDTDGDDIQFELDGGALYKSVNGKRRVGGNTSGNGVVTKLGFMRPSRVSDQHGWGGSIPDVNNITLLAILADKARIPHDIPRGDGSISYTCSYTDTDGDKIQFVIDNGKLYKSVNGVRRVGDGNNSDAGTVSRLSFRPKSRVNDQHGWGGDVPGDCFCPKGHLLKPYVTSGGNCDGYQIGLNCREGKESGVRVQDCRRCNFWLCDGCSTIVAEKAPMSNMIPLLAVLATKVGVPHDLPNCDDSVTYTDSDGDKIEFVLDDGVLYKKVNDIFRVGVGSGSQAAGIVTRLTFERPLRINDQHNWGGDVPNVNTRALVAILASKASVPHNIPHGAQQL